jgi:hypothetical protein
MSDGDPVQVLVVLRDVLLAHMNDRHALPPYRVQSAVKKKGGLRLTMRSGYQYSGPANWPGWSRGGATGGPSSSPPRLTVQLDNARLRASPVSGAGFSERTRADLGDGAVGRGIRLS